MIDRVKTIEDNALTAARISPVGVSLVEREVCSGIVCPLTKFNAATHGYVTRSAAMPE